MRQEDEMMRRKIFRLDEKMGRNESEWNRALYQFFGKSHVAWKRKMWMESWKVSQVSPGKWDSLDFAIFGKFGSKQRCRASVGVQQLIFRAYGCLYVKKLLIKIELC